MRSVPVHAQVHVWKNKIQMKLSLTDMLILL